MIEREDLARGEREGAALLVPAEDLRAEHPPPQHKHGFVARLVVDPGEALHQHAEQALAPRAVGLVRLGKARAVGGVLLVDDAHRVEHRGDNAAARGAERLPEVDNDLVELLRRQPQRKPPQIVGDVLRKLLLPQLQTAAELHGHLVALVDGEQRCDLQERVACVVSDSDAVADLDEIGKVRRDVQNGAAPAAGEVLEQADVHQLDDPRCRGLEVVEENLGDDVFLEGKRLVPAEDVAAQQLERDVARAVQLLQELRRP